MATAKEFLEKYWDGSLPVDPIALAKAVGVKAIARDPFDDIASGSGMISLTNGRPVIEYSIMEPDVRQRFTIAHELGHYFLGHLNPDRPLFRDGPREFSSRSGSSLEREANQFAARVLMPADLVKAEVKGVARPSISALAKKFGVSEVAMRYRLINLGLLSDI